MRILKYIALAVAALAPVMAAAEAPDVPSIEVSGVATINIVPDRITVEIGLREYYESRADGDSTLVGMDEIERRVRQKLSAVGVTPADITVTDWNSYLDPSRSKKMLMSKRLSAVMKDYAQIDRLSAGLAGDGVVSFDLAKLDNTDIERYNRQGLEAAINAARSKAEFIAAQTGRTLGEVWQVVDNGPNYYDTPAFSNVAYKAGDGMDAMRCIVRRYSVKMVYLLQR